MKASLEKALTVYNQIAQYQSDPHSYSKEMSWLLDNQDVQDILHNMEYLLYHNGMIQGTPKFTFSEFGPIVPKESYKGDFAVFAALDKCSWYVGGAIVSFYEGKDPSLLMKIAEPMFEQALNQLSKAMKIGQ